MKKILIMLVSLVFVMGGVSYAVDYIEEQENAYDYAYGLGITKAKSREKADMDGQLTRIAMAKMISYFAINALGLQPDTSKSCSFFDVSDYMDSSYDYGVRQACQLGLMGIGSDGQKSDNFDPYGVVTRAQFATAFSRALNLANGEIMEDGFPYYATHLQYLYSEGIIKNKTKPSPSDAERRGNVMIMMMRVSDKMKDNKESNQVEIAGIQDDSQVDIFPIMSGDYISKLKDKGVIRGPENAKITIVEFTELLCPFCQRQSQQGIINSVIQQYSGQVNSISRHFIIHGDAALQLANAMECVGELKSSVYYEVLDDAFGEYPVDIDGLIDIAVKNGVNEKSLQGCIDEGKYNQSVIDMMNLGAEVGVNGTPASILIDNETGRYSIILGAYPLEVFIETVESLL